MSTTRWTERVTTGRRLLRSYAWMVGLCVLGAGCQPERVPPGPPAPGPDAAPAPPGPADGTLGPVVVTRPGAPVATVRDVRAGGHPGFDRVVIELSEPIPSYRVEYLPGPPRDCGSGEVVPVQGATWLNVLLEPARGHDDNYQPTVTVHTLTPQLPAVVQLRRTCDFEAQYSWAIGVRAQRTFRVQELAGPPRLVIDIAH